MKDVLPTFFPLYCVPLILNSSAIMKLVNVIGVYILFLHTQWERNYTKVLISFTYAGICDR